MALEDLREDRDALLARFKPLPESPSLVNRCVTYKELPFPRAQLHPVDYYTFCTLMFKRVL